MKNRKKELTCLVTGATGVIGPSLVRYLLDKQLYVRALVRDTSSSKKLPKETDIYLGDIRDEGVISEALRGVDVIFHLAGKLHVYQPEISLENEFWEVNVEATKLLIDQAVKNGIQRFVFFSTINVYGSSDGEEIFDESSDLAPETIYAKTKAAAEKIVLDADSTESEEPIGTVLRLAAVYGPPMKGNYLYLYKGLKKRWFIPIGTGKNRRTLIYIDDVIRGVYSAALNSDAAGKIYNLTDGDIHSFNDIVNAICEALNRRPPRLRLPVFPVRIVVGLIERVFDLIGIDIPLGVTTLDSMLEDRAVSGEKIQNELGFKPKIDLIQGWNMVNDIYE